MTKENPAIKPRQKLTFGQWIFALVFAATMLFIGLHLAGVTNLPFFNTPNPGFGKTDATPTQLAKTCPATSCDTGRCCGSEFYAGSGLYAYVDSVVVNISCDCPNDTTIQPDQLPGVTGNNLKQCYCNS